MSNTLQEDILKCKEKLLAISIKHYDQKMYVDAVTNIFKTIFAIPDKKSNCPEKLEPRFEHLPESSRKIIQEKYGLNRSDT